MKLSKLHKRLRREMASHPGKAAILAILFVVALWFWIPLAWKWLRPDDARVASSATKEPAAEPSTTTVDDASPGSESPGPTWRQLTTWMDNDPRTQPTDPLGNHRDPFVLVAAEPGPGEAEVAAEQIEPPPQQTPEELGMVLSGTIIGATRRVAQINGRPYRQGDIVRLLHNGQSIEFMLAAVYPQRIVLQRDDEQFELTIPVPAASGRIELSALRD